VRRLPRGLQWSFPLTVLLRLPVACSPAVLRFQQSAVSGVPLPCLKSGLPYAAAVHGQERLGPPTFFHASLPVCHGLRTPADLHILAPTDALVVLSVCVTTLSVRTVRDHRGTIRVTCGSDCVLSRGGLAFVSRSSPDLHGYFPLDMIAALRSTKPTHVGYR
jgi:hypothetical protein